MDDVEEQSVDERVGQENGLNGIEEHCFDAQEKGLDKNELVIEEENHEDDKINGVLGKYEIGEVKNAILENQRLDMSSGLKNEILENQESQVEFEVTDQIVVENEDGVEVRIEEKHDDDDDEMILESSEVKNEGEVDVCSEVKSEIVENEESENDENGEEDIVKKVSPEDDWEGIERSELERDFAEAVNYVECGGKEKEKKLKLGVQLDLYGLHKVAVQGSCQCHHPQPMPFKLSARAKWNAWQRLGSMSREEAMERYIRLVSDRIPHWKEPVPELKTKLQIDH